MLSVMNPAEREGCGTSVYTLLPRLWETKMKENQVKVGNKDKGKFLLFF